MTAAMIREVAQQIGRAGTRFSAHNWRSAGAGNLGRLGGCALSAFSQCFDRKRRHGRRNFAERVEQIQAERLFDAARAEILERAAFPARISALALRDELSAAAFFERKIAENWRFILRAFSIRSGLIPTVLRGLKP